MNYKVIETRQIGALEEKVNEFLEKGWILQGGVSISKPINGDFHAAHYLVYCQAMIKKD